ncbi:hypothetical protein BIV57_02545 [Mangrovactinospora gilvigrisea]|uniref:DUF1254 domain-containing protein n=1 Tax=Mangrovactinospora gilvigrisea TaxID=1428644 RepID=A0A1J7CBW4_9ACTN|nr:DUF1254 domain-containing protein [Mangrovactinospora gilvigrisea]OIV39004.1 hypothetical protein BIV57_02545 [Mangrovactinospora gilvigrisea]
MASSARETAAHEPLAPPIPVERVTDEYLRALGRFAYLWGWPLVNMHNRLTVMEQVPAPGLLGGIVPAGPPGTVGMLHDYITPEERIVACPNQDVVYGFGALDASRGPSVVQVPDFGDRFWVYQVVDQRTEAFAQLGAMYGTKPGCYLLAPADWDGEIPEGIAGVFRYDTRIAVCIPRVFMNDTDADRAAVQPLINQIMVYPLAEYTGELQTTDWSKAPSYPAGDATGGEQETQWVDPKTFFDLLPAVLDEVPPRPGEAALHAQFRFLTDTAAADPKAAETLRAAAVNANSTLVQELFQFRNIGIPLDHHWSTQRNGAAFGSDYLSRTAMGKANIFVNLPSETAYFYQDLDADGQPLTGDHGYALTFPADALPPAQGFWSVTLYNEHHFFHPNELNRYSLGTKNTGLRLGEDGSLTLYAGARPPAEKDRPNWLPAPTGHFSLYLRAYWPEPAALDGTWRPPAVTKTSS